MKIVDLIKIHILYQTDCFFLSLFSNKIFKTSIFMSFYIEIELPSISTIIFTIIVQFDFKWRPYDIFTRDYFNVYRTIVKYKKNWMKNNCWRYKNWSERFEW